MLLQWLDTKPEVPVRAWYKRFPSFTVVGEDCLVKSFLTAQQTPIGTEVL